MSDPLPAKIPDLVLLNRCRRAIRTEEQPFQHRRFGAGVSTPAIGARLPLSGEFEIMYLVHEPTERKI